MNRAVARRALEAWQVGKPARSWTGRSRSRTCGCSPPVGCPGRVRLHRGRGRGRNHTARQRSGFSGLAARAARRCRCQPPFDRTDVAGAALRTPVPAGADGVRGVLLAVRRSRSGERRSGSRNPLLPVDELRGFARGVAEAVPDGDRWFQLYVLKDRDWMNGLVARAETRGLSRALHHRRSAVHGRRERDIRNAFTMPLRPTGRDRARSGAPSAWLAGALLSPPRFGNFEGAAPGGFTSVAQHVPPCSIPP